MSLENLGTVTLEVTYEDALRLWVLIHDPANAGQREDVDSRLRFLITEAVAVTEREYESGASR